MSSPFASTSTRQYKKKKETEKERRDKLNNLIDQSYRMFSHAASPQDRKTRLSRLEFVLNSCLSGASNGQVVVRPATPFPTACRQQPSSCQIDHRYLHLGCYKTIHSSTGHIIECCEGITHVNGYLRQEVMGKSPYDGFIHPEDVSYTLNEQIKMLTMANGSGLVCYRIVRSATNSQGEKMDDITYQCSIGKIISPDRFELLNVKIGKPEFESYQASINFSSLTAGTAISPGYSEQSEDSDGYSSMGGGYSLEQPASIDVPSWTVGPAGSAATYRVYSEDSDGYVDMDGFESLEQLVALPASIYAQSWTAGPATAIRPVYSDNCGGNSNMDVAVSLEQPTAVNVPSLTAWSAGSITYSMYSEDSGAEYLRNELAEIPPVYSEDSGAGCDVDPIPFCQLVPQEIDPCNLVSVCSDDSGIDVLEMDISGTIDSISHIAL